MMKIIKEIKGLLSFIKENTIIMGSCKKVTYKRLNIVFKDNSYLTLLNVCWIIKTIDILPGNVLKNLVNSNIIIRINNLECYEVGGAFCNGYYVEHVICLRKFLSFYNLKRTFCHEIGHFIDYKIGRGSSYVMNNEDYNHVYNNNITSFYKKYGEHYKSKSESFAEACSLYLTIDDLFSKEYPELRFYILNKISLLA